MTVVSAETEPHRAQVRSAWAAVLRPYPMLALGCFLNSGAPSWDCSARFIRRSREWFGTRTDDAKALAMALDLSQVKAAPLDEASNTVVRARLAEADQRRDQLQAEQLKAFIENPRAFSRGHELFRRFKHEADKLVPFAGRLISALEKADAKERLGGEKAFNTAGAIARLVAQLPDAEISRNRTRILALLDGPVSGWRKLARPLMRRTAVLGEAALPMLIGRLRRPARRHKVSWPAADAIIALCRMGLPTAMAAGPRLLGVWQLRNRERTKVVRVGKDKRRQVTLKPRLGRHDKYLFLALLRLGLRDKAEPPDLKGSGKWWNRAWQTVSPQSPADACETVR